MKPSRKVEAKGVSASQDAELPHLLPVTCYLLCMLPPLSGEPLHQRIFIHYRSVVYISYDFFFFFITLYYILYTGCGTFFKRVCHNTRTLNNKHPSMHIIVIKSETHPLMHTIMLKSKAHRCGKIRHIDLVKFTAKFKK